MVTFNCWPCIAVLGVIDIKLGAAPFTVNPLVKLIGLFCGLVILIEYNPTGALADIFINPPIIVLLTTVRFVMLTAAVALPCFINVMVFDPIAKLVAVPVMVTGNLCPRLHLWG
jgi:hypothetical protein